MVDTAFFADTSPPEERVESALEWAASRLANSLGISWYSLPVEGECVVGTRFGEATLSREALRSAAMRIYAASVEADAVCSRCAATLEKAEAMAMAPDQSHALLTEEVFEGLAAIWSYLRPGLLDRDKGLAAGRAIADVLPLQAPLPFLAIAAWATFDCLMAGLGGGLPRRYFLFMLETEINDLPKAVPDDDLTALKEACRSLPEYGHTIERILRPAAVTERA